jgi:RHS repeat-associated protein
LTTPQSATPVTYVYDAKNRLTRITDPTFGVFQLEYDAMDRRNQLTYPNGIVTSYSYDDAYRLEAIATKDAAGTLVDAWSYQYDAVGNRTAKTDVEGRSEIYQYDDLHRLTEARYADGTSEKFEYDPAGNRTKHVNETGVVTTYSYDVANQLLSAGTDTFTYDANGNVLTKQTTRGTTTFTYDAKNRVTGIVGPDGNETNQYGADDRRVDMAGASIENGQVRVVTDLAGNPILDWGGDNQTWTYRLYGPGLDEPLAEYRRYNNRKTFLHHDGLGSITAVSRDTAQVAYRSTYRAFGQMTRSSYDLPTSRLGYTAREQSVGGLMQYRSRYYDPTQGRFLQQDRWQGESTAPPSLHRYVYAFNNPVVYVDPEGTHPVLIFGVAPIIMVVTLYIALAVGLYHEFHHPRPGATTAQRVCIGLVKGFAVWGALLPFGIAFTWLMTWAIIYASYFTGAVAGIFPIAMGYIWYYVQNHHIWSGIIFAILAKVGFEFFAEWALGTYTYVMDWLENGAKWICDVP